MRGIEVSNGKSGLTMTGGQIKFPATQVPSADANTLDDYEEGTFTPSLSTPGTATYSTQDGKYTKIGRLFLLQGQLVINLIGTGSPTSNISGSPFSTVTPNSPGSLTYLSLATAVVNAHALLSGASILILGATAASSSNLTTFNVWGNGANVQFCIVAQI